MSIWDKSKQPVLNEPVFVIESKPVGEYAREFNRIALKDFVVSQNDFYLEIKEGDDLSEVPEMYLQNLKTEKVI